MLNVCVCFSLSHAQNVHVQTFFFRILFITLSVLHNHCHTLLAETAVFADFGHIRESLFRRIIISKATEKVYSKE